MNSEHEFQASAQQYSVIACGYSQKKHYYITDITENWHYDRILWNLPYNQRPRY